MKFKNYVKEGKTDFWQNREEYFIREVGKGKYEIATFKRGDTPDNVYTCTEKSCNCPARGACKHQKMLKDWIKAGKPSPFGKDVRGEVLKKLKKQGVKI